MASVSSLDQDMRSLRMGRYTPQAANEVRSWIEGTLGERLPPGDLLEALKDGVALCKLVNLVIPFPGVKYKTISMPFVQMENISHFLKACEMPPLSMPAHDRFLTVDLYEGKDPAQVLQCLTAFSRQAHTLQPSVVRTTIGPKITGGTMTPTGTGAAATNGSAGGNQSTTFGRSPSPTKFSSAMPSSTRALSPSLTGGSTGSNKAEGGTKSPPGPVSSWSNKSDEGSTAPAWNIHQYGYMGGASQGNQGISFGARRQITSQAPAVPSLAEKERLRKEKVAEEERRRQEAEEVEQRRRRELEVEEEQAKIDEERRWEERTQRLRDEERKEVEEQKRQWAEQERKWKEEEEVRRKEEAELQSMQKKPPEKPRVPSSGILRGQTLSQYQREQATLAKDSDRLSETPEQKRVRELEKQLEEARERERQYQTEREERLRRGNDRPQPGTTQTDTPRLETARESDNSWTGDEREYLRQQWLDGRGGSETATVGAQRPLPETQKQPALPTRLQPTVVESEPQAESEERPGSQSTGSTSSIPQRMQPSDSASSIPQLDPESAPTPSPLGSSDRPLPTPNKEYQSYMPTEPSQTRTDRFLSTNPAPSQPGPRISTSQEAGDVSLEQSRDRDARLTSQQKTKAGGWASKSLLEREMERERERQREWEANQAEIKDKPRDVSQGTGEGQTWDVNQYGYVGGDGMNRGSSSGSGINISGRRQILGPREMTPRKG